jgi:tetratricopeptide (TPR) repeat protein
LRPETSSQIEAPVAVDSKPSIAILLFDNINQDPGLDWLRLGLAEMLVTNLSQSAEMEVISTNQLYQILKETERLDERITSLDVIQEVAERANVETVLLGSFMKAGENIRINIRVQEAATGKILTTDKVEAEGESNLFARVDDLTQRIRSGFEIISDGEFLPLEEVTTTSPEAYRYYIEAIKLVRQGKPQEAIVLYEKAIEVDPDFAEALGGLSMQHWNRGRYKEAEAYARRALALGDKLYASYRDGLEFRLYSLREEDYARAIEALKRHLGKASWANPNNLANRYRYLERNDEAAELMEEFKRSRGFYGAFHYSNFSRAKCALGEYEAAYQVLQEGLRRFPDSPTLHASLGHLCLYDGNIDEALAAFEKSTVPHQKRWMVFVLRDEWNEAANEARQSTESTDVVQQSRGFGCQATTQLYLGKTKEARALLKRAGDVFEEPDQRSAATLTANGHVLLETERHEEAIAAAIQAQQDGKGNIPEWEGLFMEAVALARLGRLDAAVVTAEKLRQRTNPIPTEKEKRRYHHILGEIALARGQHPRAIEELEKAEGMLPHSGGGSIYVIFPYRIGNPPHVPIWYSLASAYLANGDGDKAADWLRRITETTVDRIVWPIPYVRSFYFLGKIHENRGDMEKASEYYRRFVDYWGDGDIDRERVEEAKSKLEG